MTCKFVSYLRVSTDRQGKSGLGLEAQRATVESYAEKAGCKIVAELVEVESGRKAERPKLQEAIRMARKTGATLLISKLDRLTRDVPFLYRLRDEGVEFLTCDNPHANKTMIGMMVLFAEHEAEAISKRTKDALAAAKARGVKLGGPLGAKAFGRSYRVGSANGVAKVKALASNYAAELAEDVAAIKAEGITGLQAIADALNGKGILTRHGGQWHPASVMRLVNRIETQA
ncbi:recombinase family protein [Aestuariivirga sp.]|uniref:recombinase family protein n=1 Tax=Aestuariivirga sp. TaxID=2650926 RepID=UPI003592EB91